MSLKAITEVMDMEIPDGIAKLVAVVLADYADPDTGRCWPKLQTLARRSSQSVRTVQRKLRALEEQDFLHVEPNLTGDRKGNTYVLHLAGVPRPGRGDTIAPSSSTGDGVTPVEASEKSLKSHPSGDSGDTRRVTMGSPPRDSTIESVRESVSDPDGSAPGAGAAIRDFRKDLFDRGVRTVQGLTGRPELRCRTLIGSWLKLVADDAVTVLRAIDEAIEAEAAEPVAWIEARLKRRKPDVIARPVPVASEVAIERNATAQSMVERGEWPIGGRVFVHAESPEGAAWERYFERFGRNPRWTHSGAGHGWNMPSAMPPAAAPAR